MITVPRRNQLVFAASWRGVVAARSNRSLRRARSICAPGRPARRRRIVVNELEAQRGKHLNDDAFFMLQANVQFILAKLGP